MERELDESMERRDALKLTGVWLIAGSLPWWLSCGAESQRSPLTRALEAARLNGKPVLVFVDPLEADKGGLVGGESMLGISVAEVFEQGGDELLLDVALCELACASQAQVAAVCGAAVEPSTVGLLERDGASLRWTAVVWCPCDLKSLKTRTYKAGDCLEPEFRVPHNIAGLRSALAASEAMLAARASAARAALGAAWVEEFETHVASREAIDPNVLDFAAALVRRTPERDELRSLLVGAVRERVFARGPAGSRWVESDRPHSLKIRYREDDDETTRRVLHSRVSHTPMLPGTTPGTNISECPLCGMGFSDGRGLRFLLFYLDEP